MRTLLRSVSTGLYFQGPDQWTSDPAQAHNFKLIDRALDFIDKWQLHDLELAFAFRDGSPVRSVSAERLSLHYAHH